MADFESKTDRLTSMFNERSKYHVVDDVGQPGRDAEMYVAHINAANGDPCLKIRYQYQGTSSRIIGFREENGTWDSSWDF